MSKNILLPLTALLLLIIGYIGSLYWRASRQASSSDNQDVAIQEYYTAELQKANEQRILESQDTYGGTTPQETWRLFIAALKKDDVELAAKYYVVELQDKKLSFLSRARQAKALQTKLLPKYTSAYREQISSDGNFYEISTDPIDNTDIAMTFFLKRVASTGIWKIYEY